MIRAPVGKRWYLPLCVLHLCMRAWIDVHASSNTYEVEVVSTKIQVLVDSLTKNFLPKNDKQDSKDTGQARPNVDLVMMTWYTHVMLAKLTCLSHFRPTHTSAWLPSTPPPYMDGHTEDSNLLCGNNPQQFIRNILCCPCFLYLRTATSSQKQRLKNRLWFLVWTSPPFYVTTQTLLV